MLTHTHTHTFHSSKEDMFMSHDVLVCIRMKDCTKDVQNIALFRVKTGGVSVFVETVAYEVCHPE